MKSRNIWNLIIFLLVITGLSLLYDYPETLLKRPQSVHNWRQCDGASLSISYYQEGMHFFKPRTQLLYSDNLTTGLAAPSELPLLYYFIAILYKIFGYHEFIFRAVNLFIFYLGLFYLFKLSGAVLQNLFYSITAVVLIFSSPLLVYYGNNFLPNTVALSFTFIAWYFFYRYYKDKRTKTFLISMLFFGIASCMKITELTGPIIIILLFFLERLRIVDLNLNFSNKFGIKAASMLIIFAVVAGWVFYAKYYNTLHGSVQFSTFTFPIWEMNREDINFTLHKMKVLWFKDYFFIATFWFMIAGLVVTIGFRKYSDKILFPISILLVCALIAFSLLWFFALGDHDYFYIGFYVLPAFVFINLFHVLKSLNLHKWLKYTIYLIFLSLMVFSVNHARQRHSIRYHSWMNDFYEVRDIYSMNNNLDSLGIGIDNKVIFYPSYNVRPLYLMNLKGWVILYHEDITPEIQKRDSAQMKTYAEKGAEYFITNRIHSAAAYKVLDPYMTDLYAVCDSVYIFRIPSVRVNFNPSLFRTIPKDTLSVVP